MITLGIESSCDDTAAAVLLNDEQLLANIISGQNSIHERFGGVVPELASREHLKSISSVVKQALHDAGLTLSEIDLISVTRGPGLIGSLLIGFCYAKSLAYSLGRPYVGVDHMAGHLLSAFLEINKPTFPYLALIVSGGTTALYRVDGYFSFKMLGRTRDDAAGEAFDKVARLLELGYPGGPIITMTASGGDPNRFPLPRAWLDDTPFDFSFSGLKTAVLNQCRSHRTTSEEFLADICASFQQAVVDVLVEKTIAAARFHNLSAIVLGGGVAANQLLRVSMKCRCDEQGMKLHMPSVRNCTDNAAMIAFAGFQLYAAGKHGASADDVFSRSPLGR